jgi:inorganic pyrophosphatase
MCDLTRLHHGLDTRTSTLKVVLAQARAKPSRSFADSRMITSTLTPWLPADAGFTLDLGLVPSTRSDSGAPLDILVLGDAPPTEPVASARLIGVLEADHTEKGRTRRRDHAVAVREGSTVFAQVRDIGDLDAGQLLALTRAWSTYNGLRAASFQIVATAGAAQAVRLVDRCSDPSAAPPQAEAVSRRGSA